ncbi:OLC1v1019482C1 [Oldenlandia corymbosa var. corymbosa]|uniref:OLC1v1019482C1 n=1 Tax=Oldenlandia corymbosa var. corymbosa TaxID=529605 RepID=A0AAV1EE99_OLDCO|nr:OLC1v1019482C1 [Oldenlandia corymbosa var. corymbosa]
MADAAIGVVTETLLNMVISFAAEKISLIWGVKDELEKLKKQLRMIQAMLNHVLQQKTISEPQQIWVVNLQSVSLDAQIVLEEFGYEVLRQKIEMRKKDRVQAFFSSSNPLLFRLKMAEKIKQVQQSIEYVYTEGIQISHMLEKLMEDVGSIYYDILLKSSLFQGARRDDDNNIITSRMHDIVHDFALEVSRNFCCHVEDWRDINHSIKAVHVSIKSCQKEMWKSLIPFLPSTLRTLILKGECDLSEDLFKKFKCLSVLIIRDQRFTTVKLPNSIGKLKHLRFLEFEHTSLPESIQPQNLQTIRFVAVKNVSLPKSFTKLYYLQTLRVGVLTNGGDGFDKLTNLRHMYAYRFGPMHTLAQMGNLQTIDLSEYELNLYHVPQVEVTLFKKSGVRDLKLCWLDKTGRRRTKEGGNDNIDAIMEDLNPRPNLETLKIHGCPIRKFPSWMTKDNSLSSSLHNLKGLELKDLVDCESIPALGDLPRLERLEIRGLRKVKFITEKFYGPGNVFVFPALKKLALESMDNLEEWSIGTDPAAPAQPSSSQPSVQVRLFPRLEEMALWNLPNLCAFPNLEILQRLRVFSIQGCPNLIKSSEVMKKGQGYIEEEIGIVDDDERQKHSSSTSDVVCSLISSSAPLEYLSIDCHPSSWPKDLHHLTNLEKLLLGGDFASVEMLPWPYPNITSDAAPHSVSLRHLTLYNLREVKSLPDQLQYMSSLTELWLQNWTSLEILPEWLGNLECLDKLSLRGCPSLKELPSAKTLQRLTHLTIESCGELSKRCKRRHDSVRDKISHIPNLKIK